VRNVAADPDRTEKKSRSGDGSESSCGNNLVPESVGSNLVPESADVDEFADIGDVVDVVVFDESGGDGELIVVSTGAMDSMAVSKQD
jgi:hypothetical protein